MTEMPSESSKPPHMSFYNTVAVIMLSLHACMLGYIASGNSPNCDEVGHLTAGLYAWEYGRFHLYRVNPPLVKLVAALPAYLGNPRTDWTKAVDDSRERPEWGVGLDFIRANGLEAFWYFTAGRLLCVPFTVIGGWYCFLWGKRLYSPISGIVSLGLWIVSPTVLGWGASFTPDAACASLGLVSAYHYLTWLERADWRSTFLAGLTLGLAELTKTSWLILFALYPLVWWIARRKGTTQAKPTQGLLILVMGVFLINAIYGFEGSGTPLGEYRFVSRTLAGEKSVADHGDGGNRFNGSLLTSIPVPLPYNYVRGIDLQKLDFEQGMGSYLWGEWSEKGWWYYYIVALLFKETAGLWLLFLIAVALRVLRRTALSRHELVLMLPAIFLFMLVSSQTGFSRYIRYVLPCLPAAIIFSSSLLAEKGWILNKIALGLLIWSSVSSLWVFPYNLAYFNEFAGGPTQGHRYLLDANVDWGQDLFRVKQWIHNHPEVGKPYMVHTGFVSGTHVGIDSHWPVRWPTVEVVAEARKQPSPPAPGWYIISLNELFNQKGDYRYLRDLTPVDRIGYSFWVYHIESQRTAIDF